MGLIRSHLPVKIFTAITFTAAVDPDAVLVRMAEVAGPVNARSPVYDFDSFTRYYQDEMGCGLQKFMAAFQQVKPPESLIDLKIAANHLEEEFADGGNRPVNIDPGYLTAAKVVLATTKDYDHRLYLGRGIFGDVHLKFREGRYQDNPWTYPDYQQPQIKSFFQSIRTDYMVQLQEIRNKLLNKSKDI
ncbi:MAG: DUF4416 family protein [Calditrichia bacterium]